MKSWKSNSTRNTWRAVFVFLVMATAMTPCWGKKLKTSGDPAKPISNYHYDSTAKQIVVQDGNGEVGRDDALDYDAAYKKDILDALNAVPDFAGKLTKVNDATITYNCHGKTFKSSQFWIGLDAAPIETILKEQGWTKIDEKNAKVGDIVVYRNGGAITHTGVVTAVGGGKVTQVTSKWGNLPEFTHAPTVVPQGQEWTLRGVKSKLAVYGTYEVQSGGKPLKDPEPEYVAQFQPSGLADFPHIDRISYSTAPVDSISIQGPSVIRVGESLTVSALAQGAGIGSFFVPVTFSFNPGGSDGSGEVQIIPNDSGIAIVYADEDGNASVTIEGEAPGMVTYAVAVKELGIVAYATLQVVP